jgi:hypothetical protein
MRPEIFWIDAALPGRIAIMPRPRAGDWLADEVAGWRAEGVDLVVSLLEPHEVAELGLGDEADLCGARTASLSRRFRSRIAACLSRCAVPWTSSGRSPPWSRLDSALRFIVGPASDGPHCSPRVSWYVWVMIPMRPSA